MKLDFFVKIKYPRITTV